MPTKGMRFMTVTVHVLASADIDRITRWVRSFEPILFFYNWDARADSGKVNFMAADLPQFQRLVQYVGSWEGE